MNTPEINQTLNVLLNSDANVVETNKEMNRKSPTVGQFAKNIYSEQYFSESIISDYFEAFYEGYNMQDYAFAEECQESGTKLMD